LTFVFANEQVVLIENDINSRPFSAQVLACLPPLPWSLSPEDLANPHRLDLRHVRVFSVDPPGTSTHHNLVLHCFFCFKLPMLWLSQAAGILMTHCIVHVFLMEILKWESVSSSYLVYLTYNGIILPVTSISIMLL